MGSKVLDQAEQMIGVAWGRDKAEVLIESLGIIVFRVNCECPSAGDYRQPEVYEALRL